MDAINGTLGVLDPAAVDEAAALLEQARQVFCFGQGAVRSWPTISGRGLP